MRPGRPSTVAPGLSLIAGNASAEEIPVRPGYDREPTNCELLLLRRPLAYQGFERGVATFYDLTGIPSSTGQMI